MDGCVDCKHSFILFAATDLGVLYSMYKRDQEKVRRNLDMRLTDWLVGVKACLQNNVGGVAVGTSVHV